MRTVAPLLLAVMLALSSAVADEEPSTPPSRFLEPLRTQHAETKELVSEVRIYVNSGTTDKDKIHALGDRVVERLTGIRKSIVEYGSATTRFGLQEEYDLVTDMASQANFIGKAYGRLTGVPARPPSMKEQEEARKKVGAFLTKVLRPVVAQKLGSQGLAEVLTTDSFDETVEIARGQVRSRVLQDLNEDIRLFAETGLAGGSLETYAREAGRRLVARYVGKLLAKLTPSSLVIEFVAGSIVRWVGAKLKEALRGKGNLEPRTRRSIEVLDQARDTLNGLDGRGALVAVRMALENASAALASTRYLEGDLRRAQRVDLLGDLAAAQSRLRRAIRLTKHRFLVDSKLAAEDLTALVEGIDVMIGLVRKMQADMKPGEREPLSPPDAPAAKDAVAGRYEALAGRALVDPEAPGLSTERLNLVGTMKALDFEYRSTSNFRLTKGDVQRHYKGHLKWPGGEPGKVRVLRGPGANQLYVPQELPCTVTIEKGDDGVWIATSFSIGENRWKLVKERGGAPR